MKRKSLLGILIVVMSVVELQAIIAFTLAMEKIAFSPPSPPWHYVVAGGAFVLMMGFAAFLGWSVMELEK